MEPHLIDSPRNEPGMLRDLVILLLLAALFFAPSFCLRELWVPDEVRYMEVAREMAVTGDYILPRLNGELYPEKPPVFFWLAALFYHLGFGADSARVVSALAAFGTLLMVYFFGRRIMPAPGPILAAAATVSVPLFAMSRAGVIDPLLMFLAVAAILCGYIALQPETAHRPRWWLVFYVLLALAALTKGPAGPAHAVLVVGAYAIINRKRVALGGWTHLAGIFLLLAIVSSWLVSALAQGGESYSRYLLGKAFGGSVIPDGTTTARHPQPPYYYLMLYPAALLPWTLILPLGIAAGVSAWRANRNGRALLLLLWFALIPLFFSLFRGKRLGYIMPAVPSFALLMAWYFTAAARNRLRWPRLHAAACLATFVTLLCTGALLAGFPLLLPHVAEQQWVKPDVLQDITAFATPALIHSARLASSVVVLVALLGIGFTLRQNLIGQCLCLLGAAVLPIAILEAGGHLPALNADKSMGAFCRAADPYLRQAETVYLLAGNMEGAVNLYTGRVRIPVLETREELAAALSRAQKTAVIGRQNSWRRLADMDLGQYPCVISQKGAGSVMEVRINWN